jgi:ferritin
VADELAMIGEDKSALLMLDRELGARAYPPGSPFDPAAASAG